MRWLIFMETVYYKRLVLFVGQGLQGVDRSLDNDNNKFNVRMQAVNAAFQLSRRSSSLKLEFSAVRHPTTQNTGCDKTLVNHQPA